MNAPMWTTEEISMIQELFPEPMDVSMVSSKDLMISDVFISDNAPVKFKLSSALSADNDPVTEVLLSPVGSEEGIEQCFVDESDAMTAFSMEAIDPFDDAVIAATITPAAVAPHARGKEQVRTPWNGYDSYQKHAAADHGMMLLSLGARVAALQGRCAH